MSIIFEPFDSNTGAFTQKRHPRGRLSDRAGSLFLQHRQPRGTMEATTTTHMSMSAKWPKRYGRLSGAGANVFLQHRQPHGAMSGSTPVPLATVFIGSYPGHRSLIHTIVTTHIDMVQHRQPRGFLADSTARFMQKRIPRGLLSDGHVSMDRIAFLLQQPEIYASGFEGAVFGASSEFVVGHDQLQKNIIWVLRTVFRLTTGSRMLVELVRSIEDRFSLSDLVSQVLAVRAASTVALSDSLSAHELRMLALIDRIAVSGHGTSVQEATRAIALILALTDSAATPTLAQMLSSIQMSDALLDAVEAYAHALDSIRVSAEVTGTLLLTMALRDGVAFADSSNRLLEIVRAITESVAITASLQIEGEAYTAWVMGMQGKAVWTYDDYPFNSFATIGTRRFAAGPDGISELGGEQDNGEDIAWSVQTGLTNLGTMFKKRLDVGYIGYTSQGDVGLSVITTSPEGEKVQYNYVMAPIPALEPVPNRVKLGRGLESVYYAFRYAGTGPFELHSARILKMNMKRRV